MAVVTYNTCNKCQDIKVLENRKVNLLYHMDGAFSYGHKQYTIIIRFVASCPGSHGSK